MSVDMNFAWLVVATGLIVVFGVLLLSTLLIYLYGKIITTAQGHVSHGKKEKTQAEEPLPRKTPTAAFIPQSEDDELIAVIAAAVSELYADTGKQYTVKSVKRAVSGRPAWAAAGLLDSTRPF